MLLAAAGPRPAAARTSATSRAPAADDAARRQELHNAAQARYDAGDYEGALTQWIAVHDELPPDPEFEAYRGVLLHAIASAALESHKQHGQAVPLRRALAVYERDLDPSRGRAEGGVSDPEQLGPLIQRKQELEQTLAAAAAQEQRASEPPPPPTTAPVVDPPPATDTRPHGRARALLIAGGVSVGLGLVCLGVMSWGLYEGDAVDREGMTHAEQVGINSGGVIVDALIRRGQRANQVAIATGVLAGVFVATGAALLVVGSKRRARGHALELHAPRVTVGRGFGGLSLHARF